MPAKAKSKYSHHRRTFFLVAGLIVIALIVASAALHGPIEKLVKSMSGVAGEYPVLSAIAFIVLSAISVLLAAFSSTVLIPVGVDLWGVVVTTMFLWAGWVIGGVITYIIGMKVGDRVARWIIDPETVKQYEHGIKRKASFPLVVLFQAAAPSEVVGYTLGTAKYPFLLYLAAVSMIDLPVAAGAVLIGQSFLKRQFWIMIVLGAVGIALMAWGTVHLNRKIKKG